MPGSSLLFLHLRSSTYILAATRKFSASYLTSSATEGEEHAEITLKSDSDDKSFRFRNEGIQNKYLTTVKFLQKFHSSSCRKTEEVSCGILSITESVYRDLGLKYAFSSMDFVHIQNVQPELWQNANPSANSNILPRILVADFRDKMFHLANFRKLRLIKGYWLMM